MTSRREILKALGLAALTQPLTGFAQQPQKVRRIGWLAGVRSAGRGVEGTRQGFINSLRRIGYEEGRNIAIEWRYAEGDLDRLPVLADELVRLDVEVIVTYGNEPTVAAKRATRTIPIVMAGSWMVVEHGLVESYARPGGNVTGFDWWPPELGAKSFQLLKEAVPGAKRAVLLYNPNPQSPVAHLFGDEYWRRIGSNLGLTIVRAGMTGAEDLAGALDQVAASRADVLYVGGGTVTSSHYREICAFAIKRKLVSLANHSEFLAAGGLLVYVSVATLDRVANHIDRILRGARPGDIPVEQPTKFDLVANMKVAKAMGVTFPESFMLQVTRVIE